MPKNICHLWERRFVRFLIVGICNTFFGFFVYSVMIFLDVVPSISLFLGMLMGTFFNFFTMGNYVFRQMMMDRLPRFFLCYVFIYGLNLILFSGVSVFIRNQYLAQFILVTPMAVFSYLLMNKYVFNMKKK